jgi:predicted TIM-barrel fold metal-dependent hydrolase
MAVNSILPNSGMSADPRPEWLALHTEEIIDPALPIIDPHHHLWDRTGDRYLLDELLEDVQTGHNIVSTVYVDCRSMYRQSGPPEYRPVGEVEFANGIASMAASGIYGPTRVCDAIVSSADLQMGDKIKPVLEAQIVAGGGRFRGVRRVSIWDADPSVAHNLAERPQHLLMNAGFRSGFAHLSPLGLSFDAYLFHTQIPELIDLARTFPDTQIVMDHVGGPIGLGHYAVRRAETFANWRMGMHELASCPNVWVKLGGLGMRLTGFDFHLRPRPPSSEELTRAWKPYIETCIEAFGPARSMFESNFPADKGTCSYAVLWNAFKRITAGCSQDEKTQLYSGAAKKFYKLNES